MEKNNGVPLQVEDMVMKAASQFFADELLPFLGIPIKAIAVAPTELVSVEIRRMYQDYNFIQEDDTWAHLEFESDALTVMDLRRFREYEATTSNVYQVTVVTYVVMSGKHKNSVIALDCGINTYSIIPLWLPEHDADILIEELTKKEQNGIPLSEEELFSLVLTPLMSGDLSQKDRILKGLQFLRNTNSLINSHKREKMQATLFALANKFLNRTDLDKVKEVIRMTVLGQMLKEEGYQEGIEVGLEQGLEQGLELGLKVFIESTQELGTSREVILEKLKQNFKLSPLAAEKALEKYYERL